MNKISGTETKRFSKSELRESFEQLISAGKIFGAELDPSILKKAGGGGAKFLIKSTPPIRKLISTWKKIFSHPVLPHEFFERLSKPVSGFTHVENALYFGKDRIIYDTQIQNDENHVGELTLFFYTHREFRGLLLFPFRVEEKRVVYIETISLTKQASGYASALFEYYEKLFKELGFHQFRLKASLSVGKYYWAKEGFDFLEDDNLEKKKRELEEYVKELGLPVTSIEINRLNHAYDFALFRRDIKVRVYRNQKGYYSRTKTEEFSEEVTFPLGKAFLLTSAPWDGYKTIYTDTRRRTGLVYSPEFLNHRTRRGQSEQPARISAILKELDKNGLRRSLIELKPYFPHEEVLLNIHDEKYLAEFKEAASRGDKIFQSRDCSISKGSYDAAMLAAGAVMAAVDAVMNGRVDNVFCLIRPPGHHAGRNRAMGFCFINNVAAGAVYAKMAYGVNRIFILDWDVHHGNGTQELFEDDDTVYFCSVHEHPSFCYPGTGRRMERGKGRGEGFTLNIPLRPHAGNEDLIRAFEEEIEPEIRKFQPELILISSGFDGHTSDQIADLNFTEEGFRIITEKLLNVAEETCHGRVVSVLEGGYNLEALASSVTAHILTLQGRETTCSSGGE